MLALLMLSIWETCFGCKQIEIHFLSWWRLEQALVIKTLLNYFSFFAIYLIVYRACATCTFRQLRIQNSLAGLPERLDGEHAVRWTTNWIFYLHVHDEHNAELDGRNRFVLILRRLLSQRRVAGMFYNAIRLVPYLLKFIFGFRSWLGTNWMLLFH